MMMRLLSLSFLLGASVVASAAKETSNRMDFDEAPQRDLQLEILDQFTFNFGGITVNQTVAQEACPTEWGATLTCGAGACGANIDDIEGICPGLALDDDEFLDNVGPSNQTEPDADLSERVPDCPEIEELFCELFGGSDLQSCCLLDCDVQIKNLVDCLVLDKTGEDRTECPVPVCETEAPTMAPTVSGAYSVAAAGAASAAGIMAVAAMFA